MTKVPARNSPTTFKFLIVGVVTLMFVGLALTFLANNIDDIQQLIGNEVAIQYQTMDLNYPLEMIIFELEKDIHEIDIDHFNAPHDAVRLSRISQEISSLRQKFALHDASEQEDNRLELLNSYEQFFKSYVTQSTKISRILFELEDTHSFFLDQFDTMEEKTGEKLVEYTIAGKDSTVLRQMFAIIPFCREQVLEARYHIEIKASYNAGPLKLKSAAAVPNMALNAFQMIDQTLDTFTGGFEGISTHSNLLLGRIPAYTAKVIELEAALLLHWEVRDNLKRASGALLAILGQSRRDMLEDMKNLQESTRAISRHALLVTYGVSFAVVCAFALAWLIMRHVGQRMEQSMLEALMLKQELQEKNEDLILEVSTREKHEETSRQLESQLQQSQRMESIGTLAGGIAHDFNNILAAVIGYTELASMRATRKQGNSRELAEIKKASNRAKELIQQILAFCRKSEQNFTPVQIAPIIKEVVTLLQSTLPATIEVSLSLKSPPEAMVVMADQTQLHQIIMNLCTNSFHAMRDQGGRLEVILEQTDRCLTDTPSEGENLPDGSYVKIQVRDSGSGIDPLLMERIFEPYFTTKERGEGTGLGLAVVHGIVQAYNGSISCSSEPGVGTSVEILLPLANYGSEDEILRKEAITGGKERILFVDDEAAIVDVHAKMLRSLGYSVVATLSSVDALEHFEATPDQFDLVITDMTMPEMTGAELSMKLLEIRPELPILMCTGFSEQIDPKKALEIGIKGFLMKPVGLREMETNIRRLLAS